MRPPVQGYRWSCLWHFGFWLATVFASAEPQPGARTMYSVHIQLYRLDRFHSLHNIYFCSPFLDSVAVLIGLLTIVTCTSLKE